MTELEKEMLAALKAQHSAIDQLFAILILKTDGDFYPSKSGRPWDAANKAHDLIERVETKFKLKETEVD